MPNAPFVPVAPLNAARTAQARRPYQGQCPDAHGATALRDMALVSTRITQYSMFMPLKKLAVAEEAVSLSETKRTDREIEEELTRRLDVLVSGKDAGLTFEQVFDAAN